MRKMRIGSEYLLIIIISIDLLLWFIVSFADGIYTGNYEPVRVSFIAVQAVFKVLLVGGIIQLCKEVYTDTLTGLHTRKYFYRKMKRGNKILYSLLFIDIDNFKAINDKYGHIAGDWVLMQFAGILKKYKKKKGIVARWGGEEFVMVLFHTSNKEAYYIADLIRKEVEEYVFGCEGMTINITISIGIVTKKEGMPIAVEQVMEEADKALYRAKTNKNYVIAGK